MVSKIISSLITLFVGSLVAHDNTNQITAHVNPLELGGSYIKLDHQSHFYAPNGDIVLLHLTHAPHMKHFQNEIGVGYRRFFTEFGIGANLYYMNTTQPFLLLHQLSPGLEIFYGKFQFSFNSYLPTAQKRTFKKGDLYHSTISEFGVKYSPRMDLSVGFMPNYDHTLKEWGLNSRIAYTYNDRFEFAVSPYLKRGASGCTFSFGVNFGAMKTRETQATHRTNLFSYMVQKKENKTQEQPPQRVVHIETPVGPPTVAPVILPPIEETAPTNEDDFKWWKYLPFLNGEESRSKEMQDLTSMMHDFLFMPPFEHMLPGAPMLPDLNFKGMFEDYYV